MRLLDEAKDFFWMRRITLASERQAAAIEKLALLIEGQFEAKPKPQRKQTEFALMDQEAINTDYLRRLEAERDGVELDEE
jgi:hypothetical protein